jgi:hypothetical protein
MATRKKPLPTPTSGSNETTPVLNSKRGQLFSSAPQIQATVADIPEVDLTKSVAEDVVDDSDVESGYYYASKMSNYSENNEKPWSRDATGDLDSIEENPRAASQKDKHLLPENDKEKEEAINFAPKQTTQKQLQKKVSVDSFAFASSPNGDSTLTAKAGSLFAKKKVVDASLPKSPNADKIKSSERNSKVERLSKNDVGPKRSSKTGQSLLAAGMKETCKILLTVENAENLTPLNGSGVPDAYVTVTLRGPYTRYDLLKTEVIRSTNPCWNETKKYQIDVTTAWYLDIRVMDRQAVTGDTLIGEVLIPFVALSKIPYNSSSFLLGSLTQPSSAAVVNVFENDEKEELSSKSKNSNVSPVPKIKIFAEVSECNWAAFSKLYKSFYDRIKYPQFQIPVFSDRRDNGSGIVPLEESVRPSDPFASTVFCIPGSAERCEAHLPDFVVGQWKRFHMGDLYFTNYRLVFFAKKSVLSMNGSEDEDEDDDLESKEEDDTGFIEKYSFAVTYSSIFEVETSNSNLVKEPKSRFSPLRRSANTVKVENSSFVLKLEDFREVRLIFANEYTENMKQLFKTIKRILDHKRVPNRYFPLCMQVVDDLRKVYPQKEELFNLKMVNEEFSMSAEFKEQNLNDKEFKFCELNADYQLCSSYPSVLYFPAVCSNEDVKSSADFRGKNRLPALTYYSQVYGCCIARSGQPHTGLGQKFCLADEKLINSFRNVSFRTGNDYLIFDARSEMAAGGNKLKGMGFEDIGRYEKAQITFLGIANIHAMRQSIDRLREISVSNEVSEITWLSQLEWTKWLQHLRNILLGATRMTRQIVQKGTSVLVHCSDGWDRTAQLCCLVQMLIDPKYRTFEGLRAVIEKDFLGFGHKFGERLGEFTQPDQRAPVFLQFLDCVHQLIRQFPFAFEFTSSYLVAIADHVKSGWFGTFLFNSEKERKQKRLNENSFSLWAHLNMLRQLFPQYTNVAYDPEFCEVLLPIAHVRRLELWTDYFLRYDSTAFESLDNMSSFVPNGPAASGDTSEVPIPVENSSIPSNGPATSPSPSTKEQVASQDIAQPVMWVADEVHTKCMDCKSDFSLIKRKHHCRICGGLFCFNCVSQRVVMPEYGQRPQKVCKACFDYTEKMEERKRESVSLRNQMAKVYKEKKDKPTINSPLGVTKGLPFAGNK